MGILKGKTAVVSGSMRISGERITHVPSALSLSLLSYQAFWVVGLTFTLWFALVKTYSASKLSAFTFVTPLFGVVASYFILHDKLTLVLRRRADGDRGAFSRERPRSEDRAGSHDLGAVLRRDWRWRGRAVAGVRAGHD